MRNAGMFLFALLCSGLLLVSSPTHTQGGGKKRKAEAEWVRGIANEFLELLLQGKAQGELSTSPVAFLSPDLIDDKKEVDSGLHEIAWQYRGAKFHIQATEMAPNGSEVILRGELKPLSNKEHEARIKSNGGESNDALIQLFNGVQLGSRQDKQATFTLRLAKESKSGRWTIRFMRVKTKAAK